MKQPKETIESSQEKYYRLKLERSENRRKSWRSFGKEMGVFFLMLLGIAVIGLVCAALAGGFSVVYPNKQYKELSAKIAAQSTQIQHAHERINDMEWSSAVRKMYTNWVINAVVPPSE